jgi:hypothetical protein
MNSSRRIFIGAWTLLLAALAASAQGTFTVTFDGPPLIAPGTGRGVQSYHEADVSFTPIPGTDGFTRMGGGVPGLPDNGTAYVQALVGDSLRFGLDDGSSFDPVSVDLAEYSAVVRDPVTVHFVGYRADGTVVTDDITTAGIFNGVAPVFQTFSFDPAFSSLERVEIPDFGSLDNLTLRRSVPEPGTGALMGIAAAVLAIRRLRRRPFQSLSQKFAPGRTAAEASRTPKRFPR